MELFAFLEWYHLQQRICPLIAPSVHWEDAIASLVCSFFHLLCFLPWRETVIAGPSVPPGPNVPQAQNMDT